MATRVGTTTTSQIVGKAEDVEDALYDISVRETPFCRLVGDTGEVDAVFHEWHTDKLRAPQTNAKPEGNVYEFGTKPQPVKSGNYLQIADDTFSVTGTTEAIKMYGRKKRRGGEVKRLKKKCAAELMLDIEHAMVGGIQGSDDTGGVRTSGSFASFLTTNTDRGAGGADGGFNQGTKKLDAPTDGTLRDFTEEQLISVQQSAFENGGNPSILMLPTALKRTFSKFPGLGEKRQQHDMNINNRRKRAILATMDIYIGDFGTVASSVNRFQRGRDAYLIDPNYATMAYLRKLKSKKLAVRGDSEEWGMTCEFTLIVKNEAAHGGMHDLQPVAA